MRHAIPPPRAHREKPHISTTPCSISGEAPKKVTDILTTGGQSQSSIKRKPFYPLWYTKELRNGVEKSRPIQADIGDDCGELDE